MKKVLGVLASATVAVGMTGLTALSAQADELPGGAQPVTVAFDGTCDDVTVTFSNPNDYGPFWADIKGVEPTVEWTDEVSDLEVEEGPLAGQEFGPRYTKAEGEESYEIPAADDDGPGEATFTFTFEPGSGEQLIEARVARGPEQHSLIDWVTYEVDCTYPGGALPVEVEINGTCDDVTATFSNPNDYGPFFGDVRVDGEAGTDDELTGEGQFNEGPLAGQDYGQRYQNVEFDDTNTWTHSFEPGTGEHTVEARVARGPEQHSLIDWVTYEVDCGEKVPGDETGGDKGTETGDDKGGDAGGKDDGTDQGDDKGTGDNKGTGDDDGAKDDDKGDDDDAGALPDTGAGVTMGIAVGLLAMLAGGYALLMRNRRNAQSMIG